MRTVNFRYDDSLGGYRCSEPGSQDGVYVLLFDHDEEVDYLKKCISDLSDDPGNTSALLSKIDELATRVAYYENVSGNWFEEAICGEVKHKFTREGICIRCGVDAEEWDMGCVEQDLAAKDEEIEKLRKQLESAEAHSSRLQLAFDDFYQGYMDELNRMSGWPELRSEIEWFTDNNFYGEGTHE